MTTAFLKKERLSAIHDIISLLSNTAQIVCSNGIIIVIILKSKGCMKLVSTTAFHVYLKAIFYVTSLSCNVHANRGRFRVESAIILPIDTSIELIKRYNKLLFYFNTLAVLFINLQHAVL